MIALTLLVPQFLIGLVSWIQLLLSMNRYRGAMRFTRTELWALLLFLHGGFVRWIAALAVLTSSLGFQIFVALVGVTLGWASFVVVFNEGFTLPSRQQTWALGMSLVIAGLWEVNGRLLINL